MGEKHREPRANVSVRVWEVDPDDGGLTSRAAPDLKQDALAFRLPKPHPPAAAYEPGTPGFRFWVAAEAMHRVTRFWARITGLERWQVGRRLPVRLDGGELLNAYYDRASICFFHGAGPEGTVYSGESPDVICHEVGHAVLDTLKPALFHAALHEVAAFHEAFGDISAMCAALQLRSFRVALLEDLGGELYRDSRLSRLATQLGSALRSAVPDAVDPRCLRNAVNSFCYVPPSTLPSRGPAATLSSEAHSFSRVFTAAALEILAALLKARAGGERAGEQELALACDDLAHILVAAVRASAVVPDWYAQVAANMVLHSERLDRRYPALLRQVFVQRAILSLDGAAALRGHGPSGRNREGQLAPVRVLLRADHLGLGRGIMAESASAGLRLGAAGAHGGTRAGGDAARDFVDDLVRRGRLRLPEQPDGHLFAAKSRVSHHLVEGEHGYELRRTLFDCGFCH